MNDRELLEDAARAAGVAGFYSEHGRNGPGIYDVDFAQHRHYFWNPLTDDGDALRLAVKLGISVDFGYCEDDAPVVYVGAEGQKPQRFENFPDPYAATRRAIVRAAAAAGKEGGE